MTRYLFARLSNNRFINLNHIIDISFSEAEDEDNGHYFEVRLKFIDGIREEICLTDKEFSNFYQEVKNALV